MVSLNKFVTAMRGFSKSKRDDCGSKSSRATGGRRSLSGRNR